MCVRRVCFSVYNLNISKKSKVRYFNFFSSEPVSIISKHKACFLVGCFTCVPDSFELVLLGHMAQILELGFDS